MADAYIQINVRVPRELLDRFDAEAVVQRKTRSALLRDLMSRSVVGWSVEEPAGPDHANPCAHPKGQLRKLGYGTFCGVCNHRVR